MGVRRFNGLRADREKIGQGWRLETELYRDDQTGLPSILGPYRLAELPGGWVVSSDDDAPDEIVAGDQFDAFQRMFDLYREWWTAHSRPRVYFIGEAAETLAHIKIGYSINPQDRLRQLQTSCPRRLQLLAVCEGGRDLERDYHRRFRLQRRSGEWFSADKAILAEIERLNTEPAA